jgi:hypothetical protein
MKRLIVIGCLLMGLAAVLPASAINIIDFDVTPGGAGSISYAGGANPLTGSGITPTTITGLGTPDNPGVTLACVSCSFNFATGNFTSSTASNWNFAGGGSFTLTGAVPTLSLAPGTLLMSGTFTGATVSGGGTTLLVDISTFIDTKNPVLSAFYEGTPVPPSWSGGTNVGFDLAAPATPPGAFSSAIVTSGDIQNSPVPEPASLFLMGSGLLALGIVLRKKLLRPASEHTAHA